MGVKYQRLQGVRLHFPIFPFFPETCMGSPEPLTCGAPRGLTRPAPRNAAAEGYVHFRGKTGEMGKAAATI